MAEKAWKLMRPYIAEEATFNLDPSADGSSAYTFLRALETTFKPGQLVVPRPLQSDDFTRTPHVMGGKLGELTIKLEVKGHTTRAGPGVPAAAPEADLIFKQAMGTVTRQTGSTVVSANSTTITVTGGQGVQFTVGGMFEVATTPPQRRFVQSIAGDVITHAGPALNPVPSNGQAVYASSVYKPSSAAGHKSLAFVADRDGVLYTFTGCIPSAAPKIEGVTVNGFAILSCSFKAVSWATGGKGSLPAVTAATKWVPPVVKGSPCSVDAASKTIAEFGFDFGCVFQHLPSTEADDGFSDMRLVDRNLTGMIKPMYASADWDDFRQGTERAIAFICGGAPATTASPSGWGVYVPKAQYTDYSLEERQGMVGEVLPWAANDNGANPDATFCTF